MSFVPMVPFGGYAGWAFLKRTMDTQQKAFEASPELSRDEDYFRAKIGNVKSAEDLVSDRRLLKVALGAFGLDSDIDNKYFIRKVLEDGTLQQTDLSNRLANKQYYALSAAFGFGDLSTSRIELSYFADEMLEKYHTRGFEAAVGDQNEDMRLGLNAERELATLAKRSSGEETKWFNVMGSAPLRQVFEKALGLPGSFAALDLDRQLDTLQEKTLSAFGDSSVSQFGEPEKMEALIRRFLVRSEALASFNSHSSGSVALQLLQGIG